mgnify:CR=1 FL=1
MLKFFKDTGVNISTARAGNVIGGGDFAKNRIIPDCVRAKKSGRAIYVRNPYSIRPYQHVLEAIFAYLMIVEKQYDNSYFAGNYNIGPDESDCVTTEKLVTLFCEYWNNAISWYTDDSVKDVHEANRLKLDCSLAKVYLDGNRAGVYPRSGHCSGRDAAGREKDHPPRHLPLHNVRGNGVPVRWPGGWPRCYRADPDLYQPAGTVFPGVFAYCHPKG